MVCVRIFLLAWVTKFEVARLSPFHHVFFPQLVAGNIWFWSIWLPDFSFKKFSLNHGALQVTYF